MSTFSNIYTIIAISVGIAILLFMAIYFIRRRGSDIDPLEIMDGDEFEHFCADLLISNGFEDIEVTPASHDYGIDILAKRDEITYAVQCKRYSDPVGLRAVQEAYAGKDYYDCMVGVVMTNQIFTKNAEILAKKLKILMWDGAYIRKMMHNSNMSTKGGNIDFRTYIRPSEQQHNDSRYAEGYEEDGYDYMEDNTDSLSE